MGKRRAINLGHSKQPLTKYADNQEFTLTYFVVINEAGPAWDDTRPMREQKGWTEHAAFMDGLESERLVILAGPLKGYSKHRAMLVVNAPSENSLRKRLAEDPWMRTGILRNIQFYPWEVLLGQSILQVINPAQTREGLTS